MQGDVSRSLLLDASQFYDSPELSDVTIVLVDESEQTEEHAVKRQRTGDGADGAQHAAAAGPAAQRPTVHLHGHRFLLSACSSVFKVRLAKWSEGHGNELVLHVSVIPRLTWHQLLPPVHLQRVCYLAVRRLAGILLLSRGSTASTK